MLQIIIENSHYKLQCRNQHVNLSQGNFMFTYSDPIYSSTLLLRVKIFLQLN